jgi:hypothetical protein
VQPERNAPRGRGKIRPRDVDEYGAAPSNDPGTGIVVDLDDEVIQAICPAEPIAWFIGRPPERAIIAPISGIFAPRIGGADAADGQLCTGPEQPVGPPP